MAYAFVVVALTELLFVVHSPTLMPLDCVEVEHLLVATAPWTCLNLRDGVFAAFRVVMVMVMMLDRADYAQGTQCTWQTSFFFDHSVEPSVEGHQLVVDHPTAVEGFGFGSTSKHLTRHVHMLLLRLMHHLVLN